MQMNTKQPLRLENACQTSRNLLRDSATNPHSELTIVKVERSLTSLSTRSKKWFGCTRRQSFNEALLLSSAALDDMEKGCETELDGTFDELSIQLQGT
jgi:hypothetical protein